MRRTMTPAELAAMSEEGARWRSQCLSRACLRDKRESGRTIALCLPVRSGPAVLTPARVRAYPCNESTLLPMHQRGSVSPTTS